MRWIDTISGRQFLFLVLSVILELPKWSMTGFFVIEDLFLFYAVFRIFYERYFIMKSMARSNVLFKITSRALLLPAIQSFLFDLLWYKVVYLYSLHR